MSRSLSSAARETAPLTPPESESGVGTFELRIVLAGPILFLHHPEGRRMALLMPDARLKTLPAGQKMTHADGAPAEPHVGYLRFDLANLDTGVRGLGVQDASVDPSYEIVHRLDREEIQFGLPDEREAMQGSMAIPALDRFAPVLEPIEGAFDEQPPAQVLARAFLSGGSLSSAVSAKKWNVESFGPESEAVAAAQFAGDVRWTRTIRGHGLTLRLVRFDDGGVVDIPLRPTRAPDDVPAITLKIANLCAHNPMEWDTLSLREITGPDDDFRWIYSLLEADATKATFPPPSLPVPTPVPGDTTEQGSDGNCFSGQGRARF